VSASTPAFALSEPDTAHKIVIHSGSKVTVFGDSMVNAGIGQRLRQLVTAMGGSVVLHSTHSTFTQTWANKDWIPRIMRADKPDVVIIVLGSNEVYWLSPHAPANIKKIVSSLEGRPCVWVGPPVWKGETGIVGAERDNSSPCTFFDSAPLKLQRQPDGIHPDMTGGRDWADAVWASTIVVE
jgi:acyl-CoA thioesterase-1